MQSLFPHEKRERSAYGGSPGNGISPMRLSRDPLASEAEVAADMAARETAAAPSPSIDLMRLSSDPEPTAGADDPYLFDDVGEKLGAALPQASLEIGDGPRF